MTMTYSFEKKFDPWATEPDFFDLVLQEEAENEKIKNEISLEDLVLEEIELEEDFDL